MNGQRLHDDDPRLVSDFPLGAYSYNTSGDLWLMRAPSGDWGHVNSRVWSIVEHEDRSITVSPSIWFNTPTGWHGYLARGVWRSV